MAATIRSTSKKRLRDRAAGILVIGNFCWRRTRSATVIGVTLTNHWYNGPMREHYAAGTPGMPGKRRVREMGTLEFVGNLALRDWHEQAQGKTFAHYLHCLT